MPESESGSESESLAYSWKFVDGMIVGYPESWISSRFKITFYRLGSRANGVR